MKHLFTDIIDFKITTLYSFMLVLLNIENIKAIYFWVSAFVYLGYNLHRWWIMYVEFKKRNQK